MLDFKLLGALFRMCSILASRYTGLGNKSQMPSSISGSLRGQHAHLGEQLTFNQKPEIVMTLLIAIFVI